MIPKELDEIFARVRDSANYMPVNQMDAVMTQELGNDWSSAFEYFNDKPFAAASIGQVHEARLKDGSSVVVKIQYPG